MVDVKERVEAAVSRLLWDPSDKSDSDITCQWTHGPLLVQTQLNLLKLFPWNISSHFCFLTFLLSILELVHVKKFALYSKKNIICVITEFHITSLVFFLVYVDIWFMGNVQRQGLLIPQLLFSAKLSWAFS